MIHQPIITVADILSVRAMVEGTATGDQQKRGMTWIMAQVCRRLDSPYQPGPDGERDTTFELGRHFCGVTIGNMMDDAILAKAVDGNKRTTTSKRGKPNG